jgi:hypothetical protein
MFNKSFALGRDYASARLTLSDYLGMDLRRSTAFTPTLVTSVTHGNWRSTDWTLPLVITVPSYYAADGKTPLAPARVTMTAEEWEAAKDAAFERGKLPPPNWKVVYGTPTNPRIVIYRPGRRPHPAAGRLRHGHAALGKGGQLDLGHDAGAP